MIEVIVQFIAIMMYDHSMLIYFYSSFSSDTPNNSRIEFFDEYDPWLLLHHPIHHIGD